jgi:hypothetical protein
MNEERYGISIVVSLAFFETEAHCEGELRRWEGFVSRRACSLLLKHTFAMHLRILYYCTPSTPRHITRFSAEPLSFRRFRGPLLRDAGRGCSNGPSHNNVRRLIGPRPHRCSEKPCNILLTAASVRKLWLEDFSLVRNGFLVSQCTSQSATGCSDLEV